MVRQFYLFVCASVLVACSSKREQKSIPVYLKDTALYWKDTLPHSVIFRPNYHRFEKDTTTIQLVFFDTLPETISNANPVVQFTYDTTNLTDNKFIFLSDSDYGVINNNGRHIYVAKVYENSLNDTKETTKEVFKGNGYTIKLTRKFVSNHDGTSYETGVLEIVNLLYDSIYKVHGGYRLQ